MYPRVAHEAETGAHDRKPTALRFAGRRDPPRSVLNRRGMPWVGQGRSAPCLARGLSKRPLVGLSDANAEKWRSLLERAGQTTEGITSLPRQSTADDYETVTRLSQRHAWLSDDDVAQLVSGYQAGHSVYQLAAQFGCHRQTVSKFLKASGTRMRGRPLTDEQIQKAKFLRSDGLTWTEIGQHLGVDRRTVQRRLEGRAVLAHV